MAWIDPWSTLAPGQARNNEAPYVMIHILSYIDLLILLCSITPMIALPFHLHNRRLSRSSIPDCARAVSSLREMQIQCYLRPISATFSAGQRDVMAKERPTIRRLPVAAPRLRACGVQNAISVLPLPEYCDFSAGHSGEAVLRHAQHERVGNATA